MFIEKLTIKKGGSIIREIKFRKGINLIIDETKISDKSGNNVGKTTVLRLIDFCLGGKGDNIYKDSEFKDETETDVESFLKDNNIIINLKLVDTLGEKPQKEIIIERNFLDRGEKIATIDGISYTNIRDEFCPMLSKLIFDYKYEKPTFRQIVSKNIRDEKNKLRNTINVLHQTTKSEEYEALFLFWLGVHNNLLDEKQIYQKKKTIETNFQSRLKKEGTLSEIKQALLVVSNQIEESEKKKKENFNIDENFEKDLDELRKIKSSITKNSNKISRLGLRRDLILESKVSLEKESCNVNVDSIREIYEEAKLLIPEMQKSFEDTLNFHNRMISEKISYITQELPDLEKEMGKSKEELTKLLLGEGILSDKIQKSKEFESLEFLIIEINKLYEQKGKLSDKKDMWVNSEGRLKEINNELEKINSSISNQDDLIQERITKFNEYFSNISNELYGEHFILSSDMDKKGCYTLKISNVTGNLGTGKKKGQIAAFDFAYIDFADSLGIKCLHFVLHDQIENVHENQISAILNKIVNERNCQYIIPVLRGKLPKDINIDGLEVVSLSESEKLFKI